MGGVVFVSPLLFDTYIPNFIISVWILHHLQAKQHICVPHVHRRARVDTIEAIKACSHYLSCRDSWIGLDDLS